MLPHAQEYVRHLAVQQAEIPGVERDRVSAHRGKQAIVAEGGKLFEDRLPLALEPLAVGDVRAVLPGLHKLRDDLRRILQIHVDDDERIATGRVHAGRDGELVAKVAGEGQHAHLRIFRRDLAQMGHGSIPAAIVHIDDLIVIRKRAHRFVHAGEGNVDHVLLVEHGNDQGKKLSHRMEFLSRVDSVFYRVIIPVLPVFLNRGGKIYRPQC